MDQGIGVVLVRILNVENGDMVGECRVFLYRPSPRDALELRQTIYDSVSTAKMYIRYRHPERKDELTVIPFPPHPPI